MGKRKGKYNTANAFKEARKWKVGMETVITVYLPILIGLLSVVYVGATYHYTKLWDEKQSNIDSYEEPLNFVVHWDETSDDESLLGGGSLQDADRGKLDQVSARGFLMDNGKSDIIIASPTGDVYKDIKGCDLPEGFQLYFIMRDSAHEFALGVKDLLECLKFAEEQGELPPHHEEWWTSVKLRYNIE